MIFHDDLRIEYYYFTPTYYNRVIANRKHTLEEDMRGYFRNQTRTFFKTSSQAQSHRWNKESIREIAYYYCG